MNNGIPLQLELTEEDIAQVMWMSLAQYGVIIDNITDEGDVYFTVPKYSEFRCFVDAPIFGVEVKMERSEEMMAGELLMQMANSYFEENGMIPHGGIRDQYWTEILGTVRTYQEEENIKKEGPQLLRV